MKLVPASLNTQYFLSMKQLFYLRNIVSVNAVVSLKAHHFFSLHDGGTEVWVLRYTHETTLLGPIKIMLIHFARLTPDSVSFSLTRSLSRLLSLSLHVCWQHRSEADEWLSWPTAASHSMHGWRDDVFGTEEHEMDRERKKIKGRQSQWDFVMLGFCST